MDFFENLEFLGGVPIPMYVKNASNHSNFAQSITFSKLKY